MQDSNSDGENSRNNNKGHDKKLPNDKSINLRIKNDNDDKKSSGIIELQDIDTK